MAAKIERTIKIVTQQAILPDVPSGQEGFPMRRWSVKIVAVGPSGNELPAAFIDKVVYNLHPSFPKPHRTFKKPPFKLEENGWGEFDMSIVLTYAEKSGTKTIAHDLHFQAAKYEEFTKPSQGLLKILSESGKTPGYTPPAPPAPPAPPKVPTPTPTPVATDDSKKRKPESADDNRRAKKVSRGKEWMGRDADMERLAQALHRLGEDDLLQIVRMVNEHKTPEMYVKNDLEEGEFCIDLYTLGDSLLRKLWDFAQQKVEV